jgi:putative nucleotidyltransferase with HDIG domain
MSSGRPIKVAMSLKPTLTEQDLLADTLQQAGDGLPRRELLIEAILGLAFLVCAIALWYFDPPGSVALFPAILCALVFIVASWVRFDTPYGFTVATQLAFVPLMFSMPVALVPFALVACLTVARLPALIGGRQPAVRLIKELSNAWFVIGPVAVFTVAHTTPAAAGAGLLLAALASQFVVDFVASTIRLSLERQATVATQLGDLWVYGVDALLSVMALLVAEDVHRHPLVALAPLTLLALLSVFASERHERIRSLVELNNAYRGTALVLGDVVEADDGYTGEHSRGVVRLALTVGQALGLDAEQARNLEFAALLHDVGKIAIPKEIINKPGKLDPDEWDIIATHTIEGQRMLDRVGGFMRTVGLIVRSHHERWDGRGYPDGLAGEMIPLEARIISCCDTWNAMRTDRSYREALSHEVARAEIMANSGHQFDPTIVEIFLAIIEDDAAGSSIAENRGQPSAMPRSEIS